MEKEGATMEIERKSLNFSVIKRDETKLVYKGCGK